MKKYTASYSRVNPNFVIQNISQSIDRSTSFFPIFCLVKNIIQRGAPTKMSKFLIEQIGDIYTDRRFSENIPLISNKKTKFYNTIKGHNESNRFPAKEFYNELPALLGDNAFIHPLILPEAYILDITGENNKEFIHQQVDFYLPQAKLVIEIDGCQHLYDEVNRINDQARDSYLLSHNIITIRIDVNDFLKKNQRFYNQITAINNRIYQKRKVLAKYKKYYESQPYLKDDYIQKSIKATAILRFQLLILSLLETQVLKLEDEIWNLHIVYRDIDGIAKLAIEDLFLWIKHIAKLHKVDWNQPKVNIVEEVKEDGYPYSNNIDYINIDFSMLKRYTDENKIYPEVIFVRTDYDGSIDYFEVSTAKPIKYNIISDGPDNDIPAILFLLENIFGFKEFNDGQLPIILNSLRRNDTIGILPTGSGKSLCYQFVSLLQPCINFVVCPIKSLMQDQAYNLKKKYITHVDFISSDLSAEEKKIVGEQFRRGKKFFVFISPERFQSQEFRNYMREINTTKVIGLAVIDEVHCLSEWGHDFRTSYLNLIKTIRRLCPSAKMLGLTATASSFVLEDLKKEFGISSENIKTLSSFSRPELNFIVKKAESIYEDKNKMLLNLLRILKEKGFFNQSEEEKKAGIIFTLFKNGKNGCYQLANQITCELGIDFRWFAGDIPEKAIYKNNRYIGKEPVMGREEFDQYKINVQNDFKEDIFPALCATKAFGMGIDKSNVRYTIHYGMPSSLESLYQEAGRAGRDKNPADCYLLYNRDELTSKEYDILFTPNSTIQEIQELRDRYGYEGKDVLNNFLLFLSSTKGTKYDIDVMVTIYKNNAIPNSKQLLKVKDFTDINFNDIQKALYRLSVIGVVDDWTIEKWDQGAEIAYVTYNNYSEDIMLKSLISYINKYDVEFDLDYQYSNNPKYSEYIKIFYDESEEFFIRIIRIMVLWSYDNIVYNRRQSIKNIMDLCDNYENGEQFRGAIEAYFKFSDTTFILDEIAHSPKNVNKWFDVFKNSDSNKENEFISTELITDLCGNLSRLFESYRHNTGLDFIGGIGRLIIGDLKHQDVSIRLKSAFESIKLFDLNEKNKVFEQTIAISREIKKEEAKEILSEILVDTFPDRKLEIYENIQDKYSLNVVLNDSLKKLKEMGETHHG